MAKFVWITFDRRAKAVLVEADDIEAAKAKVLEEHVQNRDEEETEEEARREWLALYDQRDEECGWFVWPLSSETL